MSKEHSGTPWELAGARIGTDSAGIIAELFGEHWQGNGAFIVRAVNSHAELVSTLEQARAALDMWATGKAMSRADVWTITNAALAASAAALAKAKE